MVAGAQSTTGLMPAKDLARRSPNPADVQSPAIVSQIQVLSFIFEL